MAADDSQPTGDGGFSGTVRLFPLPNLVLFPHVLQPLHVFEPRYRQLLEDALADDRRIAMALLQPGWENGYHRSPPIHPVACLGRVTTHHRLDDGTYNILLMGQCRVRVVEEIPSDKPYRCAKAEVLPDLQPDDEAAARCALQNKLRGLLVKSMPMLPAAHEQLDQLLGSDVALGTLTDVISYILDIDLQRKCRLLEEADVQKRARQVIDAIDEATAEHLTEPGQLTFPPDFSLN